MGYSVRHIIHTDIETYWQLQFDEQVARALIDKYGDAGDFKIVEDRVDDEGNRHRRVEVWSKVEVPAIVKKFVGDGSYTEVGRWDNKLKRYSAECIPNVNADKFRTRYEILAHPRPDGAQCEREIVTENVVKMLGVRGMIETMLEKAQRESHEHSAQFINEWVRTRL